MKPEEYLTKIEQDKIKVFNEDKVLKGALRKVFLDPIFNQGVLNQGKVDPTRNFALTPAFNMLLQKRETWDFEKIGLNTMAAAMAIQMLEQGFGELEKYRNEVKEESADVDESE